MDNNMVISFDEIAEELRIGKEELATGGKLRLHIVDGSYLDIWFSVKIEGRWAYHWERRMIDGSVYRIESRN